MSHVHLNEDDEGKTRNINQFQSGKEIDETNRDVPSTDSNDYFNT